MASFRLAFASVAVASLVATGLRAGGTESALTFHDFTRLPVVSRNPTAKVKAVVTPRGSLLAGELSAEYRQAPHHHTQEQVLLGIGGSFLFTIGDAERRMKPLVAAVPPSNAAHHMTNDSGQPAFMIEYQPLARPDWLPPFPTPPYRTDEPAAVPADAAVSADLSPGSAGWQVDETGARAKAFAGKTVGVRMVDLSVAGATIDVGTATAATVQRFVYVFDGRATLESGAVRREIGREMCVEVAASAGRVHLTSAGAQPTLIGIFEPVGR